MNIYIFLEYVHCGAVEYTYDKYNIFVEYILDLYMNSGCTKTIQFLHGPLIFTRFSLQNWLREFLKKLPNLQEIPPHSVFQTSKHISVQYPDWWNPYWIWYWKTLESGLPKHIDQLRTNNLQKVKLLWRLNLTGWIQFVQKCPNLVTQAKTYLWNPLDSDLSLYSTKLKTNNLQKASFCED